MYLSPGPAGTTLELLWQPGQATPGQANPGIPRHARLAARGSASSVGEPCPAAVWDTSPGPAALGCFICSSDVVVVEVGAKSRGRERRSTGMCARPPEARRARPSETRRAQGLLPRTDLPNGPMTATGILGHGVTGSRGNRSVSVLPRWPEP